MMGLDACLLSLPTDSFGVVLDFLDIRSVVYLISVNRSLHKKIDGANLLWFSRTVKIIQEDDELKSLKVPQTSAVLSDVDWKQVVAFYKMSETHPFDFKDYLNDYVNMLAGRRAETKVQCTGLTDLKPELYVPAAGMCLTCPLDPEQLGKLISGGYCHQAPVGRGPETILDTDIRNGWRLMLGSDVTIGSKDWNAELTRAGFDVGGMLHNIQEELMPHLFAEGDVWAQPYSMLIYEKGSFFKPHRDTLRGPNHFGSLSILLPVKGDCEGGEFVLTHTSVSGKEPRQVALHSPPKAADEKCK